MDFTFTEEQNMLRDMVREFVDNEVRPLAGEIDTNADIPRELIDKIGELGMMGICFPEEYGGGGAGETGYCIMMEEMSRGCGSTAVMIGANVSIGATAIYLDGTEEQKQKYLVPLAQGKKIGAFALTEPGAGSDAAALETIAVEDGDDYILNGQKIYITNGSIADIISVFAITDREKGARGGVSALIVESSYPGFKVLKNEDKMGIRGSHTSHLMFEDMRVPKKNVLGRAGSGFTTAMKTLDRGRLGLSAGCLGACKELLKLSTEHAKTRVQFGKPIAQNQAIQWMIADMASEIYAMESMVYRTAWMCDQGMKFARQAAIAKLYCSEVLGRVVDNAVQIHGGMGYMQEFPIERMYRDARIHRIFEGTNEVQRMIIANDVIKRGPR